jgi:hypothetical protein
VGDYALFAGGYGSFAVVDAYTQLFDSYLIFITAGSKYKINSTTEIIATSNTTIQASVPINGYIKYKGGTLS